MKRKSLLITVVSALGISLGAIALSACGGFTSSGEFDNIKANAVLDIEKNKVNLVKDMEVDTPKIIEQCGCTLRDDEGNAVEIKAEHLRSGDLTYTEFDTSTTGSDKQITLTFKGTNYYIAYDVDEYVANFYLNAPGASEEAYVLGVKPDYALADSLGLSVWLNLRDDYNYSADSEAISGDRSRALRFNGWQDVSGNLLTGNYTVQPPAEGNLRTVNFYANFLSEEEASLLDITYNTRNERVFNGYLGTEQVETLVIPEGVKQVNLASLTKNIQYEKVVIPSTARIDLPVTEPLDTRGIKEIVINEGHGSYVSFDGGIYDKELKQLYFMPASVEKVSFPDTVNTLGQYAFVYSELTQIEIPASITRIGNYCFAYAGDLTELIGLDSHSVSIGDNAFYKSGIEMGLFIDERYGAKYYTTTTEDGKKEYSLVGISNHEITEFVALEGTISIASDAFVGCEKLKSVDLGEAVKRIGDSAFSGCVSLESIELPAGLQSLGTGVFYGCTGLKTASIPDVDYLQDGENNPNYIPNQLFYGCSSLQSVQLADTIRYIGQAAFYGCVSLTQINMPSHLIGISSTAFHSCAMTSIKLPANVTSLGQSVFSHAKLKSIDLSECVNLKVLPVRCFEYSSLETIEIPEQITQIPNYCFYVCSKLTNVKLHKGVTALGTYAFSNCTALEEIELNEGLVSIGSRAFQSAKKLKEITIPDSVETVAGYAFQSCSALERITIGAGVSTFGEYPMEEDGLTFGAVTPVLYLCTSLKEVTVSAENTSFSSENGVMYGENGSVLYCIPADYEAEEFELPSTVKTILPYSVSSQKNISKITVNSGCENIGKGAFYKSLLKEVYLSDTVSHIGASILLDCKNVNTFVIDSRNPYYSAAGGDGIVYTGDGKTLVMYLGLASEVSVKEGTKTIADAVFMNSAALTSIVIPDSVESVGYQAFKGCSKLESITIGSGLKEIGGAAFAQLASLKSVTVSAQNAAFKSVNGTLYTKDGKTLIVCPAKNGITDLSGIEKTVTKIAEWAFAEHATLNTVELPANVTEIGNYAFYNCKQITYLQGSEALKKIGEYAFSFEK
nr:leucine-rich repeat domain-containing protein [Clostridia bacterium]